MKKSAVITIFVFLFLPFIYSFYEVGYECENSCTLNHTIRYDINITNQGSRTLDIVQINIRKSPEGRIVASTEETEIWLDNPDSVGSEKPRLIEINKRETKNFKIESKVPNPNNESYLYYDLCLVRKNNIEAFGYLGSVTEYCYKIKEPILIYECMNDSYCTDKQSCIDKYCIKLECLNCSFPANHTCYDYECCEDEMCMKNEACLNNKCELINCSKNEFLVNHKCANEPCPEGQRIINYTCSEKVCSYDEYYINFTCIKLNCSYDEYAKNHSCEKLNCLLNETFSDHKCTPLKCNDTQKYSNHKCLNLNCGFFMLPETHRCIINTQFMFRIILLGVILFLISIDILMFRGEYRKRLVDRLLKRARQRK